MTQAIQSTKYPDYYKMSELSLGFQYAPWRMSITKHPRIWGKLHMIEFLTDLGFLWDLSHNPYRKLVQSPILLGDISPDGGAHPSRDPVDDHSSHKKGVDVDIYILCKDGKAKRIGYKNKEQYDFERTLKLAELIFQAAKRKNVVIDKAWYNDEDVQKNFNGRLQTLGGHDDHFHIRLMEK
jgi:murein endopeptidase